MRAGRKEKAVQMHTGKQTPPMHSDDIPMVNSLLGSFIVSLGLALAAAGSDAR